MQMSRQT